MPEFPTQLYIDGSWVDAEGGGTFDVLNPATGELLVSIADGGRADMQKAIDAAARAQEGWAAMTALARSHIIRGAAQIMRERIEVMAEIMTMEQGKPLEQSRGELLYGIDFLDWFAEEGRRAYGMTIPSTSPNKRITVLKQPAGVTAAITPWNFPALQILRKLGAALAAGCTMVVKPAELTPLSALEVARCFELAGLPAGVHSVVPGLDPGPLGAAIMDDPRVRVVSFTGSTDVGKLLMRQASETMKRVSLELGGHAPFIVFDDADLDLAVEQAMASKMRNMGQTCVSANRIYVQRGAAEAFTEKLVARMSTLTVGSGMDGVDVGPLVEPAAVEKVVRHVDDAVARGATIVLGGIRPDSPGYYYVPTILLDVDESMQVAQEETFGPVAPVFIFDDEDEAIARANGTPYGLAAYFFTRDLNRAVRVAEKLDFGTVGVNDAMISAVQAPFGGSKSSGIGREGGPAGMEEFLETKYVSLGGIV